MPHEFGKWWDCLKKHTKRSQHWLPRAQQLHDALDGSRRFRYFTLCARTMIDVFMLARDGILSHDASFGNLSEVVFCESDQEDYPEIIEMLGVEGSGFPNRLEPIVLFQDNEYTAQFPAVGNIQLELENEDLADNLRDALQLKRQHLEFVAKFPFDFLNLDFCGYYYPEPPDILEINRTVDKMVGMQNRDTRDEEGKRIRVDEFFMAVTCKFNNEVPTEAFNRLERIVEDNRNRFAEYSAALLASNGTRDPQEWKNADRYDFFLGSWPKELLQIAQNHGWTMSFTDYLHYARVNDEGQPYKILCLVCHLTRREEADTYLAEAIKVLQPANRQFIDEVDKQSTLGLALQEDLAEIVSIRNERAKLVGRPELQLQ